MTGPELLGEARALLAGLPPAGQHAIEQFGGMMKEALGKLGVDTESPAELRAAMMGVHLLAFHGTHQGAIFPSSWLRTFVYGTASLALAATDREARAAAAEPVLTLDELEALWAEEPPGAEPEPA